EAAAREIPENRIAPLAAVLANDEHALPAPAAADAQADLDDVGHDRDCIGALQRPRRDVLIGYARKLIENLRRGQEAGILSLGGDRDGGDRQCGDRGEEA